MKMAVLDQSGPVMMAFTTSPIQLSPVFMDTVLCCEFVRVGVTIETAGKVPLVASVITWDANARFFAWGVSRQSANVGQIAHTYPLAKASAVWSNSAPAYSFHDSPPLSNLSMRVGTQGTGDVLPNASRYVPCPSGKGTQLGSNIV